MKRTHGFGIFVVSLLCLIALPGCDQRPAVPTIAPEPTQPVVVIVVTATSQPTLVPTSPPEATITPIPTLTPVAPVPVTATPFPVAVVQTARPVTGVPVNPTGAPPQPTAEQPTASAPPTVAVPSGFAAPVLRAPVDKDFREGDTVKYEFTSVGPLAADQCYRFDVTLGNPSGPGGAGDYWVAMCGDQSNPGDALVFDLKPPRFRDEPNYGALLIAAEEIIPPTPRYIMQAFVSVVRVITASDPIHPTVEALSPNSIALQNEFFK